LDIQCFSTKKTPEMVDLLCGGVTDWEVMLWWSFEHIVSDEPMLKSGAFWLLDTEDMKKKLHKYVHPTHIHIASAKADSVVDRDGFRHWS